MANAIWILIAFLLHCTFAKSLQEEAANTTDYDYEDDYYDDDEAIDNVDGKEDPNTNSTKPSMDIVKEKTADVPKNPEVKRDREELTTEKQFAKYEVTEIVIDVPDTNTKRIPIFSNFTVTRPLNFAGIPQNKINNSNTNLKDEGDEVINSIFVLDKPIDSTNKPTEKAKGRNRKFNDNKDEKGFFDDFYSKSFFDDDDDEFDDFDFTIAPKSKSFRDYFHDVRKDIATSFDSFTNKHKHDINHPLHKIVNSPTSFLSKLHKKSSDLAKKIHNAVSRHKFHGKDDDDDNFEDDY